MQTDKEIIEMISKLRPRIAAALADGGRSRMGPKSALMYLDVMVEILQAGCSDSRYAQDYRGRMMGGIAKTVLDDFAFAESPLGKEFFKVADAFYVEEGYQSDEPNGASPRRLS